MAALGWLLNLGFAGSPVTPELAKVSERFVLEGTSDARLALSGASDARLALDGADDRRITLIGAE